MGLFNGDCLTEYSCPDFLDYPDGVDEWKKKQKTASKQERMFNGGHGTNT